MFRTALNDPVSEESLLLLSFLVRGGSFFFRVVEVWPLERSRGYFGNPLPFLNSKSLFTARVCLVFFAGLEGKFV